LRTGTYTSQTDVSMFEAETWAEISLELGSVDVTSLSSFKRVIRFRSTSRVHDSIKNCAYSSLLVSLIFRRDVTAADDVMTLERCYAKAQHLKEIQLPDGTPCGMY
jgi:hypothetical protein